MAVLRHEPTWGLNLMLAGAPEIKENIDIKGDRSI